MDKRKVPIVFVVLVYGNWKDLHNFVQSVWKEIGREEAKIVIVNAFYNEEVSEKISQYANAEKLDLIHIENKGYSYGNNTGIRYALENYNFEWLVVSNPDVIIEKFDLSAYNSEAKEIFGPYIYTATNKMQNPHWVAENHFMERILYIAYRDNSKLKLYYYLILQKFPKIFFHIKMKFHKVKRKVFALHGSFIIFNRKTLEEMGTPFYEKMFLYAEENYLAHLAKSKNIRMSVIPEVQIKHLEDGSVNISEISVNKALRNSVLAYYPKVFSAEFKK